MQRYWVDRHNLKVLKFQQGKCFADNEPVEVMLASEVDAALQAKEQELERVKVQVKMLSNGKTVFTTDYVKLQNERDEAYNDLSRLFEAVFPQCKALPTLSGVITQVDNGFCKFKDDIVQLKQAHADLLVEARLIANDLVAEIQNRKWKDGYTKGTAEKVCAVVPAYQRAQAFLRTHEVKHEDR